jgi:hypothetical protein
MAEQLENHDFNAVESAGKRFVVPSCFIGGKKLSP